MEDYSSLKRDLWFGLAATAFSLFFALSTVLTVESRGDGVTGRTFPWLIAIALFSAGASFSLSTWRKLRQSVRQSDAKPLSGAGFTRIAVYMGTLCLYLLGIQFIGYVVSTVATLTFLMMYTGARNKAVIAVMAVLAPAGMWFAFARLMDVQFPEALLF